MDARAEPGAEIWKCKISRLETEGVLPVHAVRSVQTPGVHHVDLMVLLESGVGDEPGTYDCAPLYEQHPKLMEETILFAAQQPDMTVTLPARRLQISSLAANPQPTGSLRGFW